jgi:hypothetical protein
MRSPSLNVWNNLYDSWDAYHGACVYLKSEIHKSPSHYCVYMHIYSPSCLDNRSENKFRGDEHKQQVYCCTRLFYVVTAVLKASLWVRV